MNDAPDAAKPESPASAGPDAAAIPRASAAGRMVAYLLAGLAGGWGSFELIDNYRDYFQLPPDVAEMAVIPQPTDEQDQKIRAAEHVRDLRTNGLCLGLVGCLIAGLLGALPGLVVRSIPRTLAGVVVGALAGGVLGAVAGWGGFLFFGYFERTVVPDYSDPNYDLWQSGDAMLTHAMYWISIGLAVTAATLVSGGRGTFGRVLTATIGAGIVWAMLYPFASAMLFQDVPAEVPLPGGEWNGIFWVGTYAVLLGLTAGRATLRAAAAAAKEG